jgi:hypothetical protein
MRTILSIAILLPVLLSCDNKVQTSDKNQDSTVIENIELGKTSLVDNKLIGEWTVHLSCDGSIMCNVCPKISFRADGLGSTTNGVGTVQNLKWEMKGDKIEISNFTTDNIVGNGEYAMTYRTDKDIIGLQLINSTNSDCYKFTRVRSN